MLVKMAGEFIQDHTPEQKAWELVFASAQASAPGYNEFTGRVISCHAGVGMIMLPTPKELEVIDTLGWRLYNVKPEDGYWIYDPEDREKPLGIAIATKLAQKQHAEEQEAVA